MKNIPFEGSIWNLKGDYTHSTPVNRRQRRRSYVPNSTKLGKGSMQSGKVYRTNKYKRYETLDNGHERSSRVA